MKNKREIKKHFKKSSFSYFSISDFEDLFENFKLDFSTIEQILNADIKLNKAFHIYPKIKSVLIKLWEKGKRPNSIYHINCWSILHNEYDVNKLSLNVFIQQNKINKK